MANFLGGFVLSVLLFTASFLNWSLISLVDVVAFLLIQYNLPKIGFPFRRRYFLLWSIIIFSLLVIISQVTFLIVCGITGNQWSVTGSWWADLIGIQRIQSWRFPSVIYFLAVQLLVAFVALVDIYGTRLSLVPQRDSCWGHFSAAVEHLGSHLRVLSCLLLPAIQLVVGISHPSWVSLPFFVGSCIGLVEWSLTSNFLGLFRWWRTLHLYAGLNVVLLYVYQLPIGLPKIVQDITNIMGLYKISTDSDWMELCSGLSLVVFYIVISFVNCDLKEMNTLMSMQGSDLTEQLLPSRHSFFIRESRSGVRHTNVLLRGTVFRTFCINFFTYGFPISLFALSYWSFHFASICAFGLLVYVGYVLYAFPSVFRLHQMNGLLLVFILLWAVSTYIFNLTFIFVNWKLVKDMKIWEMIGLWRYPIPGFFLLAQFCLGVLVAVGNLVNNSVFKFLSDECGESSIDNCTVEVEEETKVLFVATVAWGLRKSSRAIMLALIFLIAMKPGFTHSLYIVFFSIYLLSHTISRKIRQSLILLCEVHFAMLYMLQLNLISKALEQKDSLSMEILLQLGLINRDSSWELLEIALLACFCAIHNHGYDMLFSFSDIVQHTPSLPVGFSVLKAGLNKSVLLSVYSSQSAMNGPDESFHGISLVTERRISSFLSRVGQMFLSTYQSCGTYIAFLTILLAIYLVKPNYVSFGYMFLLLFWIIGRQFFEKSRKSLWLPIKVYALFVFIFIYSLSIFPSFETWLSKKVDLYSDLGYNPGDSLLQNVWESLAVLIVMQLYSYERRQSKCTTSHNPDQSEFGILGFIKRILIWHSQKILYIAVFYVSLSPVSAFGFLYLLGLVICSTLPKASRVPSKLFLVYTGLLIAADYLFQLWGRQAKMFPGQKYSNFSTVLGFNVFQPGFWGIESGLRGKVLVISACTLQYNVFHWLERMQPNHLNMGKWEDPCPLFVSEEGISTNAPNPNEEYLSTKEGSDGNSFNSNDPQASPTEPFRSAGSENSSTRKFSFERIWGSTKESHKWNKKRVSALRNERFDLQMATLKVYLMFWMENMFNLFGLEINMIVMLLASFTLLNAISMLYIASLAICALLGRRIIRKIWPILVFLFASVLILEYFAIWKNDFSSHTNGPSESNMSCHECWRSSDSYFQYCRNCWLGLIVDDSRMLISYYAVFMFSCFKLRADRLSSLSGSSTYHQMMSQRNNAFVWRDLSFETKGIWTFFDYLRLYCYCHLLDLVLALVLITGTLEYDILHLGYLGFALVYFRMRLAILKKKNNIFKYLRIYNFIVIVLSLAYQSPFIGHFSEGKGNTAAYIYEVIGFHKYDYGFRITSTSSLVEIIIFVLVSLQSYMFSSQEFDYVFRYLEAEQIGAIVREQEKKAVWKTAQLQLIRQSDEKKHLRNLQVEKMKSEMLNLKTQIHRMNSTGITSPGSEGLRKRRNTLDSDREPRMDDKTNRDQNILMDSLSPFKLDESTAIGDTKNSSIIECSKDIKNSLPPEISVVSEDTVDNGASYDSQRIEKVKVQAKENALISAKQFIGDGVFQVQSIGNQAVANLATLLNVADDDLDSSDHSSSEDGVYDEIESQKKSNVILVHSSSLRSDNSRSMSGTSTIGTQIGKIFRHIWSLIQSNNDVVCYCCFILVFLWNFSLLSMVYLAALFLYALCVNTGPNYVFWVLMLIYTEIYIFVLYLYQILFQHCGLSIQPDLLQQFGFPTEKIKSSFVISSLPIFLVYLFTLIQSSITAKDGEWIFSKEVGFSDRRDLYGKNVLASSIWKDKAWKLLKPITDSIKMIIRSFSWFWNSLAQGAESPPYFVQLSMDVHLWPGEGIQPERIESGINQMLRIVHSEKCKDINPNHCHYSSKIQVQSIERSEENPKVALAVLEVVYSAPLPTCTAPKWYKSLTTAADVAKEILLAKKSGFAEEAGFSYPILSVIGGGRREVDLYAYIFGADLIVFFLVAIFYQSVIKDNSEFIEVYQLEDQFPKEYVFVLMIIFFLIVLDRIIYLCSFATGKVLYYLFNLILFTYTVTEYAWNMEPSRRHAGRFALRAIYLMKQVSLVLQAIQIRYGIPHQSTLYHQFLTSKVSQIKYLGYRIYRALPFLYELRCVLDWSCTTTSLTMYDWLKLEDIYASLYLVKCDAVLNRAEHKVGEKQTKTTKFCSGICLFFILICVIWAPMLMYSSGNPTNTANPIKGATAQVDISTVGGRLTFYQSTMCKRTALNNLDSDVDIDPQGYLDTYDKDDIQLICCQADATVSWLVPFVVQQQIIQSLDLEMNITFSWVLNRDRPKGKEVVKYERSIGDGDLPNQSDVQDVLNGTTNSFKIFNVYPKYFQVTGSGEVRPFDQETSEVDAELVLNRGNLDWWSFHIFNSSDTSVCGPLTGPMAIFVSEETPQGILGDTLSKFSIWSLYITFVLAVGRFIRLQCSDLRMRIPFENLPSCDRLIAICEDIYAARAERELGVEEVLYWTLVKVYRSPHMLLEYTKTD